MKRLFILSLGLSALFLSVSHGFGQRSGIGVYDADGWTILDPGADSRTIYVSDSDGDSKVVYVSDSEGDDANNGLSTSSPKQTIEEAAKLMRDGYPDHLLLKRGDTWIMGEGLGAFHSGRSAAEPMVVSYYGEQGDRPLIKTEGPFVWIQDLKRSNLAFVGLELYAYKHDPNSPDYNSEGGVSGISMIAASGENILIEDCKFNYMQMGAYTTGRRNVEKLINLNFRRNICIHSWAGDSYTIHELRTRVQGMYLSGADGILIEENLFDHNGWDEQIEGAGATMFNHNIYMSTANPNCNKITVRGNILARASAHGLQLRSGGSVEDNLFVQNAINLNVGYHNSASLAGAYGIVKNNVFQEVRLMDSTNVEYPRTASVRGIGEITIPSVIENNIFSHCLNEAQFGIDDYVDKWEFGGELVRQNNIVYKWTVKSEKPDEAWPDPERKIGDYHRSLGKEATTVGFLLEAGERPLKTWWPEYSAVKVNEFIRSGFIQDTTQSDAPDKLVSLLNELAAKESNPLLKEHFEAVARFTTDTSHGFEITEENMEEASRVLQFFQNEGSKWETYVNGPRPLIISFRSPSDGKYSYYKLFLPKEFDSMKSDYPFYMELHGSGGGKNDNPRRQLFMSLQPEVKGVTLQGHLKQGLFIYPWGRGDKWYRGIAESDIHEALADFDGRFRTDPRKQYIYGFSMGGGGSFRFSQGTMDRWAAVGIYSGAIFNLQEEEASRFKNMPVWMVWGDQEERIGKACTELKDLLISEGVDLYWKEIEGVGHNYLGEYQENLMEWFQSKVKEDL